MLMATNFVVQRIIDVENKKKILQCFAHRENRENLAVIFMWRGSTIRNSMIAEKRTKTKPKLTFVAQISYEWYRWKGIETV